MQIQYLFLLSYVAATSAVSRCGTRNSSSALHDAHAASARIEAGKKNHSGSILKRAAVTIKTYAHVISGNDDIVLGKSDIDSQIDTLNTRFLFTGFNFELVDTSYTSNPSWVNIVADSELEFDMKNTLRQGSYKDLNLYFVTGPVLEGEEVLGYANFPETTVNAKVFALDGVVIDPNTIPGGNKEQFNLGVTAVHEVGHWIGLFHTFEAGDGSDGCQGQGDLIDDTPAEQSAATGCAFGRNTCTGLDHIGLDPIHNYMDYSDDNCLWLFSFGQIQRMQNLYDYMRQGFAGISNSDTQEETDPDSGTSDPH